MHHFLTGLHLSCCCLHAESSLSHEEEALAWVDPSGNLFSWSFLSRGPYPALDVSRHPLVQWGREGAGRDTLLGCAALGQPAQVLHKSGCHLCIEPQWFCTCCSALEGQGFPVISPPLPAFLCSYFFAFNYFLISEEKEICGRRQF